MKKAAKKLTALTLVVTFIFSCVTVFADGKVEDKNQASRGEIINNIIENISVFARYDELNLEKLYVTALEAIVGDDQAVYEKAMRAILESIDENSAYYNEAEAKDLLEGLGDEVTGIGVNVLAIEGSIVVSAPIPGSPAEKAGIKSGDIIIAADGIDLRNMEFDTAIEHIRGKEGTAVKVTVVRSGFAEPINFNIVREKVASKPLDMEILESEGKQIAKITLYSFTENSAEHFSNALKEIDDKKIGNIIIDLRDNSGGYLDQAVQIADLFLGEGQLITTEDHKIDLLDKVYKATGEAKKYNTVIIINGMSASASEVLTAALKENEAARVVGEKSYGKGTVQTLSQAPFNAMLKYTTAYYLTPLGNNIHKLGITPDVNVKNSEKAVDMSEYDFFKLDKVYKVGDKGEAVENAKKMLQTLGLFVGEINDVYDQNLKIAVKLYQEAKGLFPYGVLDITTQMNLYDTLKNAKVEVDSQLEAALRMF